MWKCMGLFLKVKSFLRCWVCLSLLDWIWGLILSLSLKLHPRKMEPWFILWSFFLLKLFCISINLPYGHAWNTVVMCGFGAPSCYLKLLGKLQKRIWRPVGPSFAASLEPLADRQNVASYKYYLGKCSSELAQLVPLLYSRGRSTHYSDRLHDFSVTIPRCYKNVCQQFLSSHS